MNEPGALGRGHVLPLDHAVADDTSARGGELVERTAVAQAKQGPAFDGLDHRGVLPLQLVERLAGDDEDLVPDLDADVIELGVDRQRNVRGERPWRRRPHEE